MLFRMVMLFITVVIGVYLTVVIVNMGGYLDKVKKAEIRINVAMAIYNNPAYQGLPSSELQKLVDEQAELEYRRQGLDRPFILRSFEYLFTALSLNLGRSDNLTSDSGSRQVRRIPRSSAWPRTRRISAPGTPSHRRWPARRASGISMAISWPR